MGKDKYEVDDCDDDSVVLQVFIYNLGLPNMETFYNVLPCSTLFHKALQGSTMFHRFPASSLGFHIILWGFTMFYNLDGMFLTWMEGSGMF